MTAQYNGVKPYQFALIFAPFYIKCLNILLWWYLAAVWSGVSLVTVNALRLAPHERISTTFKWPFFEATCRGV